MLSAFRAPEGLYTWPTPRRLQRVDRCAKRATTLTPTRYRAKPELSCGTTVASSAAKGHKAEDTRSCHIAVRRKVFGRGNQRSIAAKTTDERSRSLADATRGDLRVSGGSGGEATLAASYGFRRRGPLWRFPADRAARAKGDDAYRAAASPAGLATPPLRAQWVALWRGAGAGPAASPLSGRHLRRRPGLCGGIGGGAARRRRRATCARLSPPVTSSKHVLSACHVPVSAAAAVALSPLSFCARSQSKGNAVYAPHPTHPRLAESGR